jgi:hypothetical protein
LHSFVLGTVTNRLENRGTHTNYIYNMFYTTLFSYSVRKFHSTSVLAALKNHRLYPSIDWERIEAGQYAVVDPVNPGVILYLSEQDYVIMVRVSITSNRTLKVLAGPGDVKEDLSSSSTSPSSNQGPNSQNSPSPRNDPNFGSGFGENIAVWPGETNISPKRQRTRLMSMFNSLLKAFKKANKSGSQGEQESLMIKLSDGNILQWFQTWHSQLSWWSRGSQMSTVATAERNSFGLQLRHFLRYQGINALIMRLKISLFAVNSYLGGNSLKSTESLGMRIRLRNGLPAFLPLYVRNGIRNRNSHFIHIWTSVLFSYKGIMGTWMEPVLEESSITSPHPTYRNALHVHLTDFFTKFWNEVKKHPAYRAPDFKIRSLFFTAHAGPNHQNSVLGSGLDAWLWWSHDKHEYTSETEEAVFNEIRLQSGVKKNLIRLWLEATNQTDILREFRLAGKMAALTHSLSSNAITNTFANLKVQKALGFDFIRAEAIELASKAGKFHDILSTENRLRPWYMAAHKIIEDKVRRLFGQHMPGFKPHNALTLQRLHCLYEAAGKVRVIAIVDYWTNAVLKPVHDWMFSILENLPQDATFDQEGKVREFATRGYKEVYSYDLKSATDLIPLILYRLCFGVIFPKELLDLWLDLLVDRDFKVPASTKKAYPNHKERVRYNCGQPMGALTSWASMALVHHALVLYSAHLAGIIPENHYVLSFIDYMVLGDDVVIANKHVAEQYLAVCKELGIPVTIHKSYISENGMFNFANQTFVGDNNWSPASLREEVQISSIVSRAEMALRLVRRGWVPKIGTCGWLAPLVKLFLPENIWTKVRPEIRSRRVHPIISWILSILFQPGTARWLNQLNGRVTIDAFLGVLLRRGELWSNPISNLGTLTADNRSDALKISIIHKWSKQIYAQFLGIRDRLASFRPWLLATTSADLEWVLTRIFEEQKAQALERWISKFRLPLKEVTILTGITPLLIKDVETISGNSIPTFIEMLVDAEASLPLVPDFRDFSIEQLSGGANVDPAASTQDRVLHSFLRISNILGAIDHLGSLATPGVVLPGREDSFSPSPMDINPKVKE